MRLVVVEFVDVADFEIASNRESLAERRQVVVILLVRVSLNFSDVVPKAVLLRVHEHVVRRIRVISEKLGHGCYLLVNRNLVLVDQEIKLISAQLQVLQNNLYSLIECLRVSVFVGVDHKIEIPQVVVDFDALKDLHVLEAVEAVLHRNCQNSCHQGQPEVSKLLPLEGTFY